MKTTRKLEQEASDDLSRMTLSELKAVLKVKGETGPKYLFNSVEESTNVHDYRYVFWLDLMGTKNLMRLSLPRAARSIMKIHMAALLTRQKHDNLEINPVMDGVYGFVKDRELLKICLKEILTALAQVFIHERVDSSRFMVRAGVAYGPIIPGRALAEGAAILRENTDYLGGTAIGMAISQAYEAESLAPPFGVYIHESARAFAPEGDDPFLVNLWRWFRKDDALTWALRRTLANHFIWLSKNSVATLYDLPAMQRHRTLADEYFKLHEIPRLKEVNGEDGMTLDASVTAPS